MPIGHGEAMGSTFRIFVGISTFAILLLSSCTRQDYTEPPVPPPQTPTTVSPAAPPPAVMPPSPIMPPTPTHSPPPTPPTPPNPEKREPAVHVPPPPPPVTPLPITIEGELPGGNERAIDQFQQSYPYLVKYLGEPFTIGSEGVTWTYNPEATQWGWNAETNTVSLNANILQQNPDQAPYAKLDESYQHETSHLFYDLGNDAVNFAFGQWIWEAHALAGQALANRDAFGISYFGLIATIYDAQANLGWETVNGVPRDGEKWQRTIVDSSATQALLLLTEVLSADSGFDYIARVNSEILSHCRDASNTEITAEVYQTCLDKAAAGKTIDGQPPGEWLFRQPVANIAGKTGDYLAVVPMYGASPWGEAELRPSRFWLFAFKRMMQGSDRQESAYVDLDVTLTVQDSSGRQIGQTQARTGGGNGIELDSNQLIPSDLSDGAYLVEAEATVNGNLLTTRNYFVVITDSLGIQEQDDRLIVVPMNADGSNLNPEAVSSLEVSGGAIFQKLPGIIVVTVGAGDAVEFRLNNYHAIISKPVTGRVVALHIEAE
jgi:hypothetical protein